MARDPSRTGEKQPEALPEGLEALVEQLARHNHDVWAARRRSEGWTHGPRRDDVKREHPDLVPYQELPDTEKEYDRATVRGVLRSLLELGFRIVRR